MLQSGPIFRKTSLFDAKCIEFAPLADYDDEVQVFDSAQNAGVLDENLHRACTWFFCAKARLAPAKTWRDVLHSPRKPTTRMHRRCFRQYVRMLWYHQSGFGDCLDRELCAWHCMPMKLFVSVAFLIVTRRSSLSCHAEKSSIPINWVWSILDRIKTWRSTDFSLNQPDCIASSISRTCSPARPQKSALDDGAVHSIFSFEYFRIFYVAEKTFHREKW